MGNGTSTLTNSLRVQRYCLNVPEPVQLSDCTTVFGSDGVVQSFGAVGRGQFKGNPDIAGAGVLLASFLAAGIFQAASCLLYGLYVDYHIGGDPDDDGKWRKKYLIFIYDNGFRALALAVVDAQAIISFAFVINFAMTAVCEVSAYHFKVIEYMLLLSLSTYVAALHFVRGYWSSPWSGTLRFIANIALLFFLVYINFAQTETNLDGPEVRPPPSSRDDSNILLPMVCYLDAGLNQAVFSNLNDEQRRTIGPSSKGQTSPEFICSVIIVVCFALRPIEYVILLVKKGVRWMVDQIKDCCSACGSCCDCAICNDGYDPPTRPQHTVPKRKPHVAHGRTQSSPFLPDDSHHTYPSGRQSGMGMQYTPVYQFTQEPSPSPPPPPPRIERRSKPNYESEYQTLERPQPFHDANPGDKMLRGLALSYRGVVLLCTITVCSYSIYAITGFKDWVHQSGWVDGEDNEERSYRGIGQIAPLMALVFVAFAVAEQFHGRNRG